jgi:phosphoglycolate phosphatase-like HAD superfamily hydrolase
MPGPQHPSPTTPSASGRAYAVVDIDGVLADVRHRLHHVERRPKDWDAFFAAAAKDTPLAEGLAVARQLALRHEIVYLSGRPERLRRTTERWLTRHDAPSGALHLRRDGDRRPARQLKLGVVRRLAATAPVGVVVDDDPEVCAALKAAGFTTFHATWTLVDETDEKGTNRALREAQEGDGQT